MWCGRTASASVGSTSRSSGRIWTRAASRSRRASPARTPRRRRRRDERSEPRGAGGRQPGGPRHGDKETTMAVETKTIAAAPGDTEMLISGSEACAEALALADIDVVTAFPIRPYDTVMQAIAKKIANGKLV